MTNRWDFLTVCKIMRKGLRLHDKTPLVMAIIDGEYAAVYYPAIIDSDWDDYPDNDNRIGNDYAS